MPTPARVGRGKWQTMVFSSVIFRGGQCSRSCAHNPIGSTAPQRYIPWGIELSFPAVQLPAVSVRGPRRGHDRSAAPVPPPTPGPSPTSWTPGPPPARINARRRGHTLETTAACRHHRRNVLVALAIDHDEASQPLAARLPSPGRRNWRKGPGAAMAARSPGGALNRFESCRERRWRPAPAAPLPHRLPSLHLACAHRLEGSWAACRKEMRSCSSSRFPARTILGRNVLQAPRSSSPFALRPPWAASGPRNLHVDLACFEAVRIGGSLRPALWMRYFSGRSPPVVVKQLQRNRKLWWPQRGNLRSA